MGLNDLAKRAYECALERGKTNKRVNHDKSVISLVEEVHEFCQAKEKWFSPHLMEYTEAQEELADVLITCLTELHKRTSDVEALILKKMVYNERRRK